VDGAVEDDALALVVVGATAVLGDVEVIDGRAEEELADIVDGLRPGVGDAVASPARGALDEGDGEAVVVGVCGAAVLLVVAVGRVQGVVVRTGVVLCRMAALCDTAC
jgi:hypothetical protein